MNGRDDCDSSGDFRFHELAKTVANRQRQPPDRDSRRHLPAPQLRQAATSSDGRAPAPAPLPPRRGGAAVGSSAVLVIHFLVLGAVVSRRCSMLSS